MVDIEPLRLRVLGPLEVETERGTARLPASKKARILLAYLALTGRAHTRARLADIFWDVADDPRGGLRWCLSRLRKVVGQPGLIVADRTTIALDASKTSIDLDEVRRALEGGLEGLPLERLETLAAHFRGTLLEGLDLPDLHVVQAWLVAQRNEAARMQILLLEELIRHPDGTPEQSVGWARHLVQLAPHDDGARARLVETLNAAGHLEEARQHYHLGLRDLESTGSSTHALRVAWREVTRPADDNRPVRPHPTDDVPTPFVGRAEDLETLDAALARAVSGHGSTVLLTGEPGVGKTRVAMELARHARRDEVPVLRGECVSAEGAPPYLPFAEALGPAVRSFSLSRSGSSARFLAHVIPEVLDGLAPDDVAADVDETNRYAVFRAVATLIDELAAPRGLVVIIEDIHWADPQSLLLLAHLARHCRAMRALIIATYRDVEVGRTHPLSDMLVTLRREGAQRTVIEPLPATDTRQLVRELLARGSHGATASRETLEGLIYERTGGNPLFVEETIKNLEEEHRLDDPRSLEDMGLPEGIRDAVGRRLSHLSDACNKMLSSAAVIAGPIEWPVLVGLAGVDEDDLLDLLDEALDAQIIRERRDGPSGSYEFGHAVFRQTLYEELSMSRRMRLHRKVVDTIERVYRHKLDSYVSMLANHAFEVAATAEDIERFLVYSRRAGERAASVMAYEQAARLYERALSVLEDVSDVALRAQCVELHRLAANVRTMLYEWDLVSHHYDRALALLPEDARLERARLLMYRMNARYRAFDTSGCEGDLREALEIAEAENARLLAQAAEGFLMTLGLATEKLDVAGDYPIVVLDVDELHREPLLAYGLGHQPTRLYWTARFEPGIENGQTLVRVARELHDPVMVMNVLPTLALSLGSVGRYRESEETFAQARQYGAEHKIEILRARAICMSAGNLADLGELVGWKERAHEALEAARSLGFRPTQVSAKMDLLMAAIAGGEVEQAERLLPVVADAVEAAKGWHGWVWAVRFALARAQLHAARGQWPEALDSAQRAIDRARAAGRTKHEIGALWVQARARAGLGRDDEASQSVALAVERARGIGHVAYLWRSLVMSHCLARDEVAAEAARREAEALADTIASELSEGARARWMDTARAQMHGK